MKVVPIEMFKITHRYVKLEMTQSAEAMERSWVWRAAPLGMDLKNEKTSDCSILKLNKGET